MSEPYRVAVLVGSLRKDSFSSKIAAALKAVAPSSLQLDVVSIRDLPFYDPDIDAAPPAAWTAFRQELRASAGVIMITPEYNRTVPAVLKNAIDVASRPYGQSSLTGAVGIISQSPGSLGGVSAAMHLKQILPGISGPMLQQPEVYLSSIMSALDADGNLTGEAVRGILTSYLQAFAALVIDHARKAKAAA